MHLSTETAGTYMHICWSRCAASMNTDLRRPRPRRRNAICTAASMSNSYVNAGLKPQIVTLGGTDTPKELTIGPWQIRGSTVHQAYISDPATVGVNGAANATQPAR